MHRIVGSGLITALLTLAVAPGKAQTRADTLELAAALAEQFDSLEVHSVAPYPTGQAQPLEQGLAAWIESVAEAAHLTSTEGQLPVCPWGGKATLPEAGYLLRLSLPEFEGSRAAIRMIRQCDNPEGYVHDVYGQGEKYWFESQGGQWRFARIERLWIT